MEIEYHWSTKIIYVEQYNPVSFIVLSIKQNEISKKLIKPL